MIVIKGYGANTIITSGYGKSGLIYRIKVEVLRLVSYIRKTLSIKSEL